MPDAASVTPRERGFAVYIVFMLIAATIMTASVILWTNEADLQVAGWDRESAQGFYAAESGLAFAEDWLATSSINTISNTVSAWTQVLGNASSRVCSAATAGANPAYPGTVPKASVTPTDIPGSATNNTAYAFCVHNNATDPNYYLATPTGETTDSDSIISVEAYGWGPGDDRNSISSYSHHISADVKVTIPLTDPPVFTLLSWTENKN